AGLAEKAVDYWLKAGQQALARSAMTEAVAQLRKGLDVLVTRVPDGLSRRQQELDLQMAPRPVLAATEGVSAAAVGETLARARELAEKGDRPEYLFPLSLGQWSFHFMRSEHKLALSCADHHEKFGVAGTDFAAQLWGPRPPGLPRLFLGDFVASRDLLVRCYGFSDPTHRAVRGSLSDHPIL